MIDIFRVTKLFLLFQILRMQPKENSINPTASLMHHSSQTSDSLLQSNINLTISGDDVNEIPKPRTMRRYYQANQSQIVFGTDETDYSKPSNNYGQTSSMKMKLAAGKKSHVDRL